MNLDRLQWYKQQLAASPTGEWGKLLYGLVRESSTDSRGRFLKGELETCKLRLTIAIGALEVYAQPSSFKPGETPEELAHLAQVTLDKMSKVEWLQENRPPELR